MSNLPPTLIELSRSDERLRFRLDPNLGNVTFLAGDLAKEIDLDAVDSALRTFLQTHSELFGALDPQNLQALPMKPDRTGVSVTYQQFHGTVKVHGGTIHMHVRNDGTLRSILNHAFPDLADVPTEPAVTAEDAESTLRTTIPTQGERMGDITLLVYRHDETPRLVWQVRIVDDISHVPSQEDIETKGESRDNAADHLPHDWVGFVDAITGKVLEFYDNIRGGSGIGYYSGPGSVNSRANGSAWELIDDTRSHEVQTRVAGPSLPAASDDDDHWDRPHTLPRNLNQGAEVDAHRFAGNVVDYFDTVHGVSSFDGTGTTHVQTLVHYQYHPATPPDQRHTGFWMIDKVVLTDGTGSHPGYDYPTTDDWVAHELTHGYTLSGVVIPPTNEPGALYEAISDIFAAYITGNWKIFERSWLGSIWGTFGYTWTRRNLEDPTNLGSPVPFPLSGHYNSADPIGSYQRGHMPDHYDRRYTGAADGGGAHINSGIIGHLFYLLTMGGTHGYSSISVGAIGQSAAETLLWDCIKNGLTVSSDFLGLRLTMMVAWDKFFQTDLYKLAQIKNAFHAVGIGPDLVIRDNLADNGDEPSVGPYLAVSPDIINRQVASADPSTDFADMTKDTFCQNVEHGQDNYIYVRVRNRAAHHSGDATINVYLAEATTFATPASWIHIGSFLDPGVAPGSHHVIGPIVLQTSDIPAPGHYCLIAIVNDPYDPAPDHSLITSVADFIAYVRNSNNIAWRNLNVVDLVANATGSLRAWVRGLEGSRDRFDLRIALDRFLPGSKLHVRGPQDPLDGAIPRGLVLVRREGPANVYHLLSDNDRRPQQSFTDPELSHATIGFDHVLVENAFPLEIGYELPAPTELEAILRAIGSEQRVDFELRLIQLWEGHEVGAVALRFVRPIGANEPTSGALG